MDTAHFKSILENEKENLVKQITFVGGEDPYLDKNRASETFDDSVTENESHDRVTATKAELEVSLKETKAALRRIEEGTFGICTNCGDKISSERLEALPTASFCASCQGQQKGA